MSKWENGYKSTIPSLYQKSSKEQIENELGFIFMQEGTTNHEFYDIDTKLIEALTQKYINDTNLN